MASISKQTLGVELEFLVFYKTPGALVSTNDDARYGPVIEAPLDIPVPPGFTVEQGVDWRQALEAAWVRQQVANVITNSGFVAKENCLPEEVEAGHTWNVVPDRSLKVSEAEINAIYQPLKYVGVEVQSPAFVAGPVAFFEISSVVKAINSAFRTAVPPVCGLHIHVGRGGVPLELRPVQRTASLIWVAENLLSTLHPGCRIGNSDCLDMKHYSNLSLGLSAEGSTPASIGLRERQHAAYTDDRVDKNREKPTNFQYTPPAKLTANFRTTPSRSLAGDYGVLMYDPRKEITPGYHPIVGVQSILRCTDTMTIADMLGIGFENVAYSFVNMELQEEPEDRNPTIEFRQATGSLDEDWVVVWAKICLALCGPAVVDSADDDFFQLLYDCLRSGKEYKYNVLDLLHDIGITNEDIAFVHHRLVTGRHEREPVLPFHRPDDCPGGLLDEGYVFGWHKLPQEYGALNEEDEASNEDDASDEESDEDADMFDEPWY
ncbi:hypothetical protein GQX73_g4274 [Xylaria multiplex]|uniref:Amidoligase enzyme n=1 Tax=Xylaria multiplex TaxID=323545 RepID=A0A7C8IPY4_9PEZI|nr:hypothetical protein GQX73_g4274 [Xylaria multiplex]